MGNERDVPYKSLGVQLQELRQKLQETLSEVAGAVEIDEHQLTRIEQGAERPSEDILMLLINHFGIREDEATNLWLLAGYDTGAEAEPAHPEEANGHNIVVMMTLDTRILYSDQAQVTADKHGVVISFLQNMLGPNNKLQRLPVARLGMSYEQAHDLLGVMQRTLQQAEQLRRPKELPAPNIDQGKKRPNAGQS